MTFGCSVIIPTFNRGGFVGRAIRSVANQDCVDKTNIEIIVIDDGSTDDTQQVVCSMPPMVAPCLLKYIQAPHSGEPGTTRNAGLAQATKEFVAYCDSDDFWFPHHLATASREFEKNPDLGMVSTYWGFASYTLRPDGFIDNRYEVRPHEVSAVNTNCRVHRRSCICQIGNFGSSRWGEDGDFFSRIERNFKCAKVLVTTNVCGYIRGGNNLTFEFDNNIRNTFR